MEQPQSGFSYKIMSLMFKARDAVKPRGDILKEVGINTGDKVLDFGCGPGGYVPALSKMVGISGKVYALDMNPLAINSVKEMASRKKLVNVTTILSEGPTGLKEGSVDTVLLYDILHHLKNPGPVLRELHRVLKPGRVLSVSDHHMQEMDITSRITGTGLFQTGPRAKTLNFTRVN